MDFTLADFLELTGLREAVEIRRNHTDYGFDYGHPMPMDSIHIKTMDLQFVWDATPEGFDYWRTVRELWVEITIAVNGK